MHSTEPVWSKEKGNFRVGWWSTDIAPRVTQTVGIVRTDYLQKNPDVIKGIKSKSGKPVAFSQKLWTISTARSVR